MDKRYKVNVYQHSKYNENKNAFSKQFTWGVHSLEHSIASYKMDVPISYDEEKQYNFISYAPVITLIDDENNYYSYNELYMEILPTKNIQNS